MVTYSPCLPVTCEKRWGSLVAVIKLHFSLVFCSANQTISFVSLSVKASISVSSLIFQLLFSQIAVINVEDQFYCTLRKKWYQFLPSFLCIRQGSYKSLLFIYLFIFSIYLFIYLYLAHYSRAYTKLLANYMPVILAEQLISIVKVLYCNHYS